MSLDFSIVGARLLGQLAVPAASSPGNDASLSIASDDALIARVLRADDRDAFGELVHRHQSSVRNFLRHLARGDAALADDLAQETFVRAYHSLRRFNGTSTFGTWLLGIAHNHFRNARRRARTAAHALAQFATEPPSADAQARSDLAQDLARALEHLSEDERTVLHLHYHQGLSHADIAAVLPWPLGTIKTHLARSKEKLRTHLAAWNPDA